MPANVKVGRVVQDEALQDFFFNTKRCELIEATLRNLAWGIGLAEDDREAWCCNRWNGLNLLGFALMRVRTRLMKT